jgi:hypothetical protein
MEDPAVLDAVDEETEFTALVVYAACVCRVHNTVLVMDKIS